MRELLKYRILIIGYYCLALKLLIVCFIKPTSIYDEVWVLPYIPVHQEGQNKFIDSSTEI